MIAFQFHTELFEFRARAMQALSAAGFDWFLDYTSVDLDHERFGIEVCGIQEEPKAEQILSALRPAFPSWGYSEIWEQYSGSRDLGWVVLICSDPRPERSI